MSKPLRVRAGPAATFRVVKRILQSAATIAQGTEQEKRQASRPLRELLLLEVITAKQALCPRGRPSR